MARKPLEGLRGNRDIWLLPSSLLCSVAQTCPALCNPMDCSPPGSSVLGILQARTLEWVSMPSSRGSSQIRNRTQVSHIAGGFFYHLSHQGSQRVLEWIAYPFSSGSSDPEIKPRSPALQVDSLPDELLEKPSQLINKMQSTSSPNPKGPDVSSCMRSKEKPEMFGDCADVWGLAC